MNKEIVELGTRGHGLPSDIPDSYTEENERNTNRNTPSLDAKPRSKTSLRIRYEAEAEVIKRKLGDLEGMRIKLGLSQRKICQLLLVDPSAWSRWVRSDENAPPHIYRMLQWYLALEEKYPALDVNFWLATVARVEEPIGAEFRDARFKQIPGRVEQLTMQIADLQGTLETQRRLVAGLVILSFLSALLAFGLLVGLLIGLPGWRLEV
jgi:transcriptional regulator with XRE-family HTH domain